MVGFIPFTHFDMDVVIGNGAIVAVVGNGTAGFNLPDKIQKIGKKTPLRWFIFELSINPKMVDVEVILVETDRSSHNMYRQCGPVYRSN